MQKMLAAETRKELKAIRFRTFNGNGYVVLFLAAPVETGIIPAPSGKQGRVNRS